MTARPGIIPPSQNHDHIRACEALVRILLPAFSATSALLNFRAFPWVLGAESLDPITYAVGFVVSAAIAVMLTLLWYLPFTLAGDILFDRAGEDV